MNFNDILKKSFLEQFNTYDLTFESITIALLITALIGVYIFSFIKTYALNPFILEVLQFLL